MDESTIPYALIFSSRKFLEIRSISSILEPSSTEPVLEHPPEYSPRGVSFRNYLTDAEVTVGGCIRGCRDWNLAYEHKHPTVDSGLSGEGFYKVSDDIVRIYLV